MGVPPTTCLGAPFRGGGGLYKELYQALYTCLYTKPTMLCTIPGSSEQGYVAARLSPWRQAVTLPIPCSMGLGFGDSALGESLPSTGLIPPALLGIASYMVPGAYSLRSAFLRHSLR